MTGSSAGQTGSSRSSHLRRTQWSFVKRQHAKEGARTYYIPVDGRNGEAVACVQEFPLCSCGVGKFGKNLKIAQCANQISILSKKRPLWIHLGILLLCRLYGVMSSLYLWLEDSYLNNDCRVGMSVCIRYSAMMLCLNAVFGKHAIDSILGA